MSTEPAGYGGQIWSQRFSERSKTMAVGTQRRDVCTPALLEVTAETDGVERVGQFVKLPLLDQRAHGEGNVVCAGGRCFPQIRQHRTFLIGQTGNGIPANVVQEPSHALASEIVVSFVEGSKIGAAAIEIPSTSGTAEDKQMMKMIDLIARGQQPVKCTRHDRRHVQHDEDCTQESIRMR